MKSPGLPLILACAISLLGGGVLIGRFVLPRGEKEKPSDAGDPTPATNGALPAPLAGLPATSDSVEPFKGNLADLLREARAAGDYSGAQLRVTLLLAQTPAAVIARLAGELVWKNNPDWEENAVRSMLIQRWAETDPKGALDWTESLPKNQRSSPRSQILGKWARGDAPGALKYARALRDNGEREGALTTIAGVVANDDPREALRILQGIGGSSNNWRFGNVFAVWAKDDPAAAHAAALSLPNEQQRRSALSSVFSSWAQNDPEAAKDAAMALPNGATRTQALQSVLATWATTDPEAAYGVLQSLPAGQARTNALHSIIQNWMQTDSTRALAVFDSLSKREKEGCYYYVTNTLTRENPAAALEWAQKLPGRDLARNALSNVISEWASHDAPAAAAALAGLPSHLRGNHYQSVASQWMQSDRGAALRWARSLEGAQDRARALAGCVSGLDLGDGTEINAILAELPQGSIRSETLRQIGYAQGQNDPEGTLAWMRSLSEEDRATALKSGVLEQIAEADPKGIAALLRDFPSGLLDANQLRSAAQSLAKSDPQAALTWAATIEAPRSRDAAIQAAIQSWAETDPQAALAYGRSLADNAAQKKSIESVLERWANDDPDGLVAWAQTANGEDRTIGLLKGSESLARSDPRSGADLIASLLREQGSSAPSEQMQSAVGRIASGWAGQDVNAACQWASTLPAGNLQNKAVGSIASSWLGQDPMAASAWIAGLPTGDARDGAVGNLVGSISRTDPESAFIWAESIGDASQRQNSLSSTVTSWREIDPEAARRAVNQAALPDDLRTSLLRRLDAESF